jgi:hypothetical protein
MYASAWPVGVADDVVSGDGLGSPWCREAARSVCHGVALARPDHYRAVDNGPLSR